MQQLTQLRSKYPILRRNRFLSAQENERIGLKEITWVNASGKEMTEDEWRDEAMRCFGMLLDGRAQTTGIRQRGQDATILIVLNAYHDLVNFTLPGEAEEARWLLLADTNMSGQPATAARTSFAPTDNYGVTGRSLVICSLEAASDSVIDRSKPGRNPRGD